MILDARVRLQQSTGLAAPDVGLRGGPAHALPWGSWQPWQVHERRWLWGVGGDGLAHFEVPYRGLSAQGSLRHTFLKGDVLHVTLGHPPPSGVLVLEVRGCGLWGCGLAGKGPGNGSSGSGDAGAGDSGMGGLACEAAWGESRQAPPVLQAWGESCHWPRLALWWGWGPGAGGSGAPVNRLVVELYVWGTDPELTQN